MLIIFTTHPIQYQTPIWQALARDGRVPFEVWYLTRHGVQASQDAEFGKKFSWDIDTLSGYPHRFLEVMDGATPTTFWLCRLREPLVERLRASGAKALWVQGWQVAAYWQAVWAAKRAGVQVWMRAESNDLAPVAWWKRPIKRLMLGQLFRRVDRFLYIGSANQRLYRTFGVREENLLPAPYAVDNERFRKQKAEIGKQKLEIRRQWGIPEDAFCVLFCGKFIPKKRPMDLIAAAKLLEEDRSLKIEDGRSKRGAGSSEQEPSPPRSGRGLGEVSNPVSPATKRPLHLLFVGAGELGGQLRNACHVVYDADNGAPPNSDLRTSTAGRSPISELRASANVPRPRATFAGFLNQTEISRAYVAADCLGLPSDYGETWGLVVNEAMASGLPCLISDQCGCAEDLGRSEPNAVFRCGDVAALADGLLKVANCRNFTMRMPPSFDETVETVVALSTNRKSEMLKAENRNQESRKQKSGC